MQLDDFQVRRFLRRSMNMRVATLSGSGVPHITPLRFIYDGRTIYALTRIGTPTARHIRDQPAVVLLFDAEQSRTTSPVLRVRAQAVIDADPQRAPWLERRAAVRYFLRPGGVWNMVTHWRRLPVWARSRCESSPDRNALIAFSPVSAEFMPRPS